MFIYDKELFCQVPEDVLANNTVNVSGAPMTEPNKRRSPEVQVVKYCLIRLSSTFRKICKEYDQLGFVVRKSRAF